MQDALRLAVVIGILQGIFEWLPISSEGNVALYLTVVEGLPEGAAVQYALFLHAGTALAAAVYYRDELGTVLRTLPDWGPSMAFADKDHADVTFLVVATVTSGIVGILAYLALDAIVSAVAGGAFVALIGVLLVVTGAVQWAATRRDGDAEPDGGTVTRTPAADAGFAASLGERDIANVPDGLLVGVLQGLAILPGVSRSGTTVSALLLRGIEEEIAFRLSFLLSIPAALGAGLLVLVDTGLPTIGPLPAAVALVTSAVVGYATIGGLMGLVRRVAFWVVCVLLGVLAVIGGALVSGVLVGGV